MRATLAAGLAGVALAAAGCAGPPEPEPPRVLEITVTGGAAINPNSEGTATPVVVSLMELTQASGFAQAGFFDLHDSAETTLGTDLLRRERVTLRPGASETLTWTLDDRSKALGAVVAFRDLDRAEWRASAPLGPEKAQTLGVTVTGKRVAIGAE